MVLIPIVGIPEVERIAWAPIALSDVVETPVYLDFPVVAIVRVIGYRVPTRRISLRNAICT